MARIPKVTVSFDADLDSLKKGVKGATTEVDSFSDRVGDFGKKAGLAFAAAGVAAAAYAGKLLIDGVKSAIEDEAAQLKLATTLKNVTGATNDQIAATEAYITKTALANGVTDDLLRPSLDRLIRSTGNVTEAQKLQQLALDISAGSGKSLAAVSEALAKAHDGNFAALKKLGVPIDENIIKTKDYDAATAALAATFGGQAAAQADTFQGKMARLTIAFDEAKETVGSYVLDAITPLLSTFVDKGIPAITNFANTLGEKLGPAFAEIFKFVRDDLLPILMTWWKFLYEEVIPAIISVVGPILLSIKSAFDKVSTAIKSNSTELQPFFDLLRKVWEFSKKYLIPEFSGPFVFALNAIATLVSTLITGFSQLVGFMSNAYTQAKRVVDLINANKDIFAAQSGLLGFVIGKVAGRASGGPVTGGTSYLVGERGPELFTPNSSGMITPNNRLGGGNTTINLNVTGAIDPEGTARSIVNLLNNSFYRGTNGAANLVSS
jgi:Flp pilus assembly pilin Flp